jgi:outer membrane protein assembly factor BamB
MRALILILAVEFVVSSVHAQDFGNVTCEGTYQFHLQGICADKEALYWCFTTQLVKTDQSGKLLKRVPVADHHGDLCFHDGKLYVAVNLGKFNDPNGNADSWVYVYNASDLSFVSKHKTGDVFHGAGGIGIRDDHFFIVGGLPDGVEENYVYEYDAKFTFLKKHILESGHTHLGIQTATFAEGHWWFGCYGDPKILLRADADLQKVERFEFDCSLGIVPAGEGRFLIGRGPLFDKQGCTGSLVLANADEKHGLVLEDKVTSTDWPQWRGPRTDNLADGRNLPLHWSKTENIRWSVTLPGWGTSSPVVFGERVFVTSQVEDGGKKSLLLLCFSRKDGKELWRHDFGLGVDQRSHEKSNLAVNTPAVTEDAVYVAYGNADIARYSHEGELIWVRRYMADFGDPKMSWGYAVSPLVVQDSVVFPWDHHNGPCFLIGLDKATGEIAWKQGRPIGTAHATPLLVEHHSQQDLLVPGKHRLTAFDVTTHEKLWEYGEGEGPFNGEIISSPAYGDGVVYLQLWRQSRIHAIRLRDDGQAPEELWTSKTPGPVEPSLLYYRGLLYVLMDNGVLACLDGKTGAEQYRERLGGNCNSSPIASDGKIYLSNNDGKTFVVRAGTKFEVLATNDLGERITATPAITGNALLFRTDSHLYLIDSP